MKKRIQKIPKSNVEMKFILFGIILFVSLFGCKTGSTDSLTTYEQNKLLQFAIKIEEDSLMSVIGGAKHGLYYMVGEQFQDSIYFDTAGIYLIDKNINLQEIQLKYKNEIKKCNELVSNNFDIVRFVKFSGRSPEFLSFSKPIKYLDYYFLNLSYNSWFSGYSSFLIIEMKEKGNYKLVYRRIYRVT